MPSLEEAVVQVKKFDALTIREVFSDEVIYDPKESLAAFASVHGHVERKVIIGAELYQKTIVEDGHQCGQGGGALWGGHGT